MATFNIEIQEFLTRVIEIEAVSSREAMSEIRERYNRADIVLDYNDFVEVEFIDIHSQSKDDEIKRLTHEVIEYFYSLEERLSEELKKTEIPMYKKIERLKSLIE